MRPQLPNTQKSRILFSNSPSRATNNSLSAGLNNSQLIYVRTRDASPSYRDSTFGASKRIFPPNPTNTVGFLGPTSTLTKKYAAMPKNPRKMQLNEHGLDSPAASKYDIRQSFETLYARKEAHSFGKATRNALKIVDPEANFLNSTISFVSPGPANYSPKYNLIGIEGPKISISKRESANGYRSYKVNFPSPATYDPKPTYLRKIYGREGVGLFRAPRDHSYLPKQQTPGPGGYNTKDDLFLTTSGSFGTMGRAKKKSIMDLNDQMVPGPGAYNLRIPIPVKQDWNYIRSQAESFRYTRRARSVLRS